jgi:hypothetical protein
VAGLGEVVVDAVVVADHQTFPRPGHQGLEALAVPVGGDQEHAEVLAGGRVHPGPGAILIPAGLIAVKQGLVQGDGPDIGDGRGKLVQVAAEHLGEPAGAEGQAEEVGEDPRGRADPQTVLKAQAHRHGLGVGADLRGAAEFWRQGRSKGLLASLTVLIELLILCDLDPDDKLLDGVSLSHVLVQELSVTVRAALPSADFGAMDALWCASSLSLMALLSPCFSLSGGLPGVVLLASSAPSSSHPVALSPLLVLFAQPLVLLFQALNFLAKSKDFLAKRLQLLQEGYEVGNVSAENHEFTLPRDPHACY